jgi:Secretion system C-terminal sorting domain
MLIQTSTPSAPGFYTGTSTFIDPVDTDIFWNGTFWEVSFTVTGFSGFYIHSNNFNAPLPITINYFTGVKQGTNHLLNWKVTCNSTPRVTMTLERSADSRNFTGINTTTADAARCNQPFDYTDANPLKGMNYYRLKMVDVDGKISYSSIVALLNAVKGFDIVSIAPNPVVTDNFKLNVASAQAGKMEMVIFDMQGRLVNRQSIPLIAGFNSLPVNVGNLAAGTYTIQAVIGEERSKVMRFVKE